MVHDFIVSNLYGARISIRQCWAAVIRGRWNKEVISFWADFFCEYMCALGWKGWLYGEVLSETSQRKLSLIYGGCVCVVMVMVRSSAETYRSIIKGRYNHLDFMSMPSMMQGNCIIRALSTTEIHSWKYLLIKHSLLVPLQGKKL